MTDAPPQPPKTITCVDCLGTAHLLSSPPPDGFFEPGDFLIYRCEDCDDRWDLVFEVDDDGNH